MRFACYGRQQLSVEILRISLRLFGVELAAGAGACQLFELLLAHARQPELRCHCLLVAAGTAQLLHQATLARVRRDQLRIELP